jgi:hypothetical protein
MGRMRTSLFLYLTFIALCTSVLPGNAQDRPKIEIVQQILHPKTITSVAVSQDGTYIVTGDFNLGVLSMPRPRRRAGR